MVTNENDENGIGAMRVTRAKAAALTAGDDLTNVSKKPLQTKRSAVTMNTLNGQRRRAALGDVTNASKGAEIQDEKKALGATKPALASKAARPTGVQKLNRTNSARSALGVKENNAKSKSGELKRPGSGSGVLGDGHRKRIHTSTSTLQSAEDTASVADNPSKQAVSTAPSVTKEVKVTAQACQDAFHDLDAEDVNDPLMVAEYVGEIFEYYRTLETLTMPNPDYMDHQDDLEWKMRGILIDWLIEVHTRFRLLPETLFLAVNIIDRFLSQKVVPLDKLQLVGVTAMFIASKYEEVLSPHIGNFVHVADDGFTVEEVLSAERYTLQTLKYDLSYPNPMNFLRRISKADNYDIQTRTIGKYLLEISLVDHRFMRYPQSHVAATAMYVARLILESGPWVSRRSAFGIEFC
jgi:G2/mitotic-specific cyclin 1/2